MKLLLILWFVFYLFNLDYAAPNYPMITNGTVGGRKWSCPNLRRATHNPGSFLVVLMKNGINCSHYVRFSAGTRTEHFPYRSQKRYCISQSTLHVSLHSAQPCYFLQNFCGKSSKIIYFWNDP